MFNLSRKKAANLLQNAYRLTVRTKRCRRERQKILAAAGVLQQIVRAWVARRIVQRRRETRRRSRAAATLQRAMRRHLRKLLEHRQKVAAALTLWKFVGGFSVKLSLMRRRRKSSAATRIQSAFRTRRSRVRVSALRAEQLAFAAASRIQAVTRGHKSRVKTRALLHKRRSESAAGTRIQAAFRGHRSREQTRALRFERQERAAATKIQSLFKGHRSRLHTRTIQAKRRACAVKIQGLLLQQRRKAKRASPQQRERCALSLQRAWRKSRMSGDEKLLQHGPTNTTLLCNQRSSSSPTPSSSKARRKLDRTNLQLAVEALANGMSRRDVITPIGARDLKETLALREDDPVLETALRQRLLSIEAALNSPIGRVVNTGRVDFTPMMSPIVEGAGVEEALRRSLGKLERSVLMPSE